MAATIRAFLVAFTSLVAVSASAQTWPAKPVRMVVPFAPGAGTDAIARILAARLGESLGQQFVVDNRPGAGGTIGTDIVAKAAPDGYTILFSPAAHAINPSLYPKLGFDTRRDFTVVSIVAALPVVLAVETSVPARTVSELAEVSRAKPGTLTLGSAGNGTVFHLLGEQFKAATGADLVHVPFKGGAPAVAALIAGQVSAAFETSLTLVPHVKAGKLRALAVASEKRIALLPDVPTLAEAGVSGLIAENWYGLYAPSAAPKDVVPRLYAELARALASPDVREKLAVQGAEVRGLDPERSARFVDAEIERWARVVKQSGAKID